jgi:hypothetical protein
MTRIAVVGFGYWSKNLIRNFYESSSLTVACGADEARQNDVDNRFPGVQFTTSFDDAVALATPAISCAKLAEHTLCTGNECLVANHYHGRCPTENGPSIRTPAHVDHLANVGSVILCQGPVCHLQVIEHQSF